MSVAPTGSEGEIGAAVIREFVRGRADSVLHWSGRDHILGP